MVQELFHVWYSCPQPSVTNYLIINSLLDDSIGNAIKMFKFNWVTETIHPVKGKPVTRPKGSKMLFCQHSIVQMLLNNRPQFSNPVEFEHFDCSSYEVIQGTIIDVVMTQTRLWATLP